MSDDMSEYLPVRVRDYPTKGDNGDSTFDDVLLGEVCDEDEDTIEIGFTVKNVRLFVMFRKSDLRAAIEVISSDDT